MAVVWLSGKDGVMRPTAVPVGASPLVQHPGVKSFAYTRERMLQRAQEGLEDFDNPEAEAEEAALRTRARKYTVSLPLSERRRIRAAHQNLCVECRERVSNSFVILPQGDGQHELVCWECLRARSQGRSYVGIGV